MFRFFALATLCLVSYSPLTLGRKPPIKFGDVSNEELAIYTRLEYPNLREFYNQVVAKQAEQIILKKQ
jgi:hypothetical protein